MITVTTERLLRMRADAKIERDTLLEHRMRDGQDPAVAVAEMPEVDEFVVRALRDEMLEDRGQLAEYGLARLASRSASPDADEHRRSADRVEFDLLREIAAEVPELTPAVWAAARHLDIP